MKPIQLVDLKGQYLKIKPEVDQAIAEVLDSTVFIGGEHVKGFSKELEDYLNVRHVIPCANGTDALQIALMALDAKPGDEILTPSFTYIATCEVIALLGLTPVFVEVHEDTYTIDLDDARKKITSKTKAIVPVHLYGQCANMDKVLELAKEHEIQVIEDTAQAIGSRYLGQTKGYAGTIGDIGTTSFFPSKNLGCYGDGGAMLTNNDELAAKIRMIANHGQSKRYYHDSIGVNSRLDNIQAAVLRIKLKRLDEYARSRQYVANCYNEEFSVIDEIETPVVADWSEHVYHQYTMKLKGVDREGLQHHLSNKGIPSNIYYPVPAHLQKGYAHYSDGPGSMPKTEHLSKIVLSLPIHTEMEEDQIQHITNSIKEFIRK
ncbi:MAG: DegT/DnrJ/EryC1/StrS family aminotransferase [Salibacteraceae bacterium]